ncbi:MAG: VOC family protein [Planctomycetes bacterium]|nr:VOC family protein [Planctomycetota bacterium]
MPPPSTIAPCIWFQSEAEAALQFYASVFEGAQVASVIRAGEGGPMPKGTFIAGRLALRGNELMVLNGNPQPAFSHTNSIIVACRNQAEIDRYWTALTNGGSEIDCGWLTDKYGVVWQIVPDSLERMLADPDPAKAQRAMAAMMTMKKFDIAALERAYAGQ